MLAWLVTRTHLWILNGTINVTYYILCINTIILSLWKAQHIVMFCRTVFTISYLLAYFNLPRFFFFFRHFSVTTCYHAFWILDSERKNMACVPNHHGQEQGASLFVTFFLPPSLHRKPSILLLNRIILGNWKSLSLPELKPCSASKSFQKCRMFRIPFW